MDEPQDDNTAARSEPHRAPYYWLPNVLTTGTLWAGFYAIVAAIDHNFPRAGLAVFGAMIFDGLDGRVARWTNTQSEFGKEYDSLSDMVAFGLAPAILAYQWGVARIADYNILWGRIGWAATFLYAAAAAMRLARFNTRTAADKRYFEGLPSPSAAATVAGFIWVASEYDLRGLPALVLAFVITSVIGALMVSRFAYWSGKELNPRGRIPWAYFLIIPIAYIVISIGPGEALFGIFAGYALSAPAIWIWRKLFHRRAAHPR
ncbi:MAG: CDP-diacylglycerol--serine O-phosphatidyltransferase [Candidatus Obscuribacterales bacterium]|nr:CDP-diacylglycerol--serine O-phosphatidyltransferase [Steroidobacteraceae bacterium]